MRCTVLIAGKENTFVRSSDFSATDNIQIWLKGLTGITFKEIRKFELDARGKFNYENLKDYSDDNLRSFYSSLFGLPVLWANLEYSPDKSMIILSKIQLA